MSRLRLAVIGGGRLGTIHARLIQQVPDAELVAIAEPHPPRAAELAEQFECPVTTDLERLINSEPIDAAVIAAPTTLHHQIGTTLLSRGIHTLIEKPLAPTVVECEELVHTADQHGCVLQVGHVERFSPVWAALRQKVGQPRWINATREAPLTLRSMDVGVVLDLMIHDLDLVVSMVRAPVVAVQAVGSNWTGRREDLAQARLTFANGCVANFSASRVSCAAKREMTVFGSDWYGQIDFAEQTGTIVYGPEQTDLQTRPMHAAERARLTDNLFTEVLAREALEVETNNPILDELVDFVTSIKTNSTPIVSGRDGLEVVEIANQIVQRIEQRAATMPVYRAPHRKAG